MTLTIIVLPRARWRKTSLARPLSMYFRAYYMQSEKTFFYQFLAFYVRSDF